MELEKRVNALEQEVKILKNQIQKTLLDIQEQVLTHHYPSLRTADGTAKQNGSSPAVNGNGRYADEPHASERPVKKVTLDELTAPTTNAETDAAADADAFDTWAAWVDESVQKFGVTQTRSLIKIRAQSGSLSPETAVMLQQIVTLYADNNSEENGRG